MIVSKPMLDPSLYYQWFVTESFTRKANGKSGANLCIKLLCVTEAAKASMCYHLADGSTCEVFEQILYQLGHNDPSARVKDVFIPGYHVYAKVSPLMQSDGRVRYVIQPLSVTKTLAEHCSTTHMGNGSSATGVANGSSTKSMADESSRRVLIEQTVNSVMAEQLSYKETLDKMTAMGPEYVKAYRLQRKAGVGV